MSFYDNRLFSAVLELKGRVRAIAILAYLGKFVLAYLHIRPF